MNVTATFMKGDSLSESEIVEAARLFEEDRKPFKWIAYKLGRDEQTVRHHVWRYLSSQGR